ncbi:Coiled-coil domain-containing protein 129 [Triplophysa tibetana]|uniref:Coiled-coil domain-containing protein 129 n=1 Tax=Triplophysa tibetana TaxID=1572043 RepID=A0A5A9N6C7_9TELE|nr:Coiled-coil domain-containing protein 129 [Triplophysa tibetana]
MDVLNMMQDDPEEFLLDLGFGIDEPDLTGRIPARFLSYQSNARGISLQLFLDAQQSRMDIENPDVRSRFRQLEVLQQVTTTFSNLVGAQGSDPLFSPTEARERRKHVASILRRAAKKTLRQERKSQAKPSSATSPKSDPESLVDKRIPPKRSKVSDSSSLSPLKEEHAVSSEPVVRVTTDQLKLDSVTSSVGKGTREPLESFELEEVKCSGSAVTSSLCGVLDSQVTRTNSHQSDSRGVLEEPFIPALLHHNSIGSEPRKRLNGISQDDTKSLQKDTVNTKEHAVEPHRTTENCSHSDASSSPSINSVLGKENSGSINNIVDSHTVLGTADSAQTERILTENRNSDSSSPHISQMNSNGVYTLAYFVQMDPVSFPMEIRDRLQTSDQRFYTQTTSLFEELQSAQTNYSPAVPGTIVENTLTPHEECEPVVSSETAVSDHAPESQYQTDIPVGCDSPTALKRRRESFSRRSWSDVFIDNDSGVEQTPTTYSPFTSVETSTPYLWNSMERSRDVRCLRVRSVSLDTGLSYEEEDRRWHCALWAGTHRCFYCGSPVRYNNSWAKIQPELQSDLPYSLNELEDMMKCMRRFRTILTEIELRLEEEQASVLGPLSESYREEVEDVLRLRAAVKEEAGMLEQQLSDLVHHYDDSIKIKLNRLLDEQSQLCSQLQIVPSDPPGPEPASTRSVAVQCCLIPVTSSPQRCSHQHCTCHTHQRTWQDSHRSPYQTQWDSNYKPDQLDFVAFMKSSRSTGCVRSLSDKADHTLTMHEHLYGNADMDNQKLSSEEHQQDKMTQKKPRRKDTPVLNSPPLIPGKTSVSHCVRLMKTEARMIHQEEEEKEMKK